MATVMFGLSLQLLPKWREGPDELGLSTNAWGSAAFLTPQSVTDVRFVWSAGNARAHVTKRVILAH